MKNYFYLFILGVLILLIASCVGQGSVTQKYWVTEEFEYVDTQKPQSDDILLLANWLKDNPDKRVVSMTGILYYRDDVSGYVIHFVRGDNSNQKFTMVENQSPEGTGVDEYGHGVTFLQKWKNKNHDAKIIAISSIASSGGGVKSYLICYE